MHLSGCRRIYDPDRLRQGIRRFLTKTKTKTKRDVQSNNKKEREREGEV